MAAARSPDNAPEMEDCFSCRLTGSITLLGVGAYFLNERSKLPRHDLGQRRWLLACACTFAAAGVWRATTHSFEAPVATAAVTISDDSSVSTTPKTQPWYGCKGCSREMHAWFRIGNKPKKEQHHVDDK